MLGVTDNRAKLWVDCLPVTSVAGYLETPLRERGRYDIQDGYLSVAQIVNSPMSYPVSIMFIEKYVIFLIKITFFFYYSYRHL